MLFLVFVTAALSIDSICHLCLRWGEPALEMARAGATEEEIRPIALRKCDQLAEDHPLYGKLCTKAVQKLLPQYIAEAQLNNLTALQYCEKKRLC